MVVLKMQYTVIKGDLCHIVCIVVFIDLFAYGLTITSHPLSS